MVLAKYGGVFLLTVIVKFWANILPNPGNTRNRRQVKQQCGNNQTNIGCAIFCKTIHLGFPKVEIKKKKK